MRPLIISGWNYHPYWASSSPMDGSTIHVQDFPDASEYGCTIVYVSYPAFTKRRGSTGLHHGYRHRGRGLAQFGVRTDENNGLNLIFHSNYLKIFRNFWFLFKNFIDELLFDSIRAVVYECNTVDFGYKGLRYKRLSLMRDDFSGPFDKNVRNFRQLWGTFGYKGLIDPVPSGPSYPKSTVFIYIVWSSYFRVIPARSSPVAMPNRSVHRHSLGSDTSSPTPSLGYTRNPLYIEAGM